MVRLSFKLPGITDLIIIRLNECGPSNLMGITAGTWNCGSDHPALQNPFLHQADVYRVAVEDKSSNGTTWTAYPGNPPSWINKFLVIVQLR